MARRLGASVVIDPTREDLRERVMALTRGRGADVVCEAVGKPALVTESLTLVRPRGVVQLVGVSPSTSGTCTSARCASTAPSAAAPPSAAPCD